MDMNENCESLLQEVQRLEARYAAQVPESALATLHRVWRQVPTADRLRFLIEMLTPNERRVLSTGLFDKEP
jgi:hypothetical protein